MKNLLKSLLFFILILVMSFPVFAQSGYWYFDGTDWSYHLTDNQQFKNGWHEINGENYYFDSDGLLLTNRITPDNYYVNQDGVRVDDSGIDPDEMQIKSQDCRYIVFNKSSHHIEFWQFGEKTHTFIATSGRGSGNKEKEDDMKTPEGEFYICKKVPYSSYKLGLAINYPTHRDAERGIASGLISKSQYNQVVNANLLASYCWGTPLGGEIEFHGNRQPTDATRGCIGMRGEDIEILYKLVVVGDKVLIQP